MKTYTFAEALNNMTDIGEEWTFEESFGKYRVLDGRLEYHSPNGWEGSANTYNTLNEETTWHPVPAKPKRLWRRMARWPGEGKTLNTDWHFSKKEFMIGWPTNTTFGPWESMEAPDFVKDSVSNYDD